MGLGERLHRSSSSSADNYEERRREGAVKILSRMNRRGSQHSTFYATFGQDDPPDAPNRGDYDGLGTEQSGKRVQPLPFTAQLPPTSAHSGEGGFVGCGASRGAVSCGGGTTVGGRSHQSASSGGASTEGCTTSARFYWDISTRGASSCAANTYSYCGGGTTVGGRSDGSGASERGATLPPCAPAAPCGAILGSVCPRCPPQHHSRPPPPLSLSSATSTCTTSTQTRPLPSPSLSPILLAGALLYSQSLEEMYQHPPGISPDPDVVMEGYLYKRSSNAFKTWNRRWFQIKDNKLLYLHRSGDDSVPTVMEENLMLCLVRPAPPSVDRLGCFELVTPSRSHLLQADSESLCNAWMRALQRTILHLHESDAKPSRPAAPTCSSSPSSSAAVNPQPDSVPTAKIGSSPATPTRRSKESLYGQVVGVAGNEFCADCGQPEPKWASINLGVTLCIECCGIHRSLGVQVSKVRSLTMDSLDDEVLSLFSQLGNTRVNSIFLAKLPDKDVVPPPANLNSTRTVREAWIKAKYVEGRFTKRAAHLLVERRTSTGVARSASSADVARLERMVSKVAEEEEEGDETHSDEGVEVHWRENPIYNEDAGLAARLLSSAASGDVPGLLSELSNGADVNAHPKGTTALHAAVKAGQATAVEFLLLNGAKINQVDAALETALHVAARGGRTLQVCQLLKRGADKSLVNAKGECALDIAVEGKHADIVTLFRVHTMRDEFNEEFDNPMNQTVDDVILDITRRAAKNGGSGGGRGGEDDGGGGGGAEAL